MNEIPPLIERIHYFLKEIDAIDLANMTDGQRQHLNLMALGAKDAAALLYFAIQDILGRSEQ